MQVRLFALLAAVSLITGCHRTSAALTPISGRPAFDPIVFFTGHIHSSGVLENRSGAPTEWVTTDCQGQPETADRLRMVQHLSFQDGTSQQRDWVLWRSGPDQYEASANDMIGTAIGSATADMFHWQWVLARSPSNALLNVTMNQWMYPMADGSLLIRTTVSKFDIILMEVTEQFVRG